MAQLLEQYLFAIFPRYVARRNSATPSLRPAQICPKIYLLKPPCQRKRRTIFSLILYLVRCFSVRFSFAACGKTKKPSLRIRTTCAVVPPYFTDYSALFPRLRRAAVPVTAVVFSGADSSSFSRGKALFVSVSMKTCPLSAAGRQERIFFGENIIPL